MQFALVPAYATMLAGEAEQKLEQLPFSSLAFFQLHHTISQLEDPMQRPYTHCTEGQDNRTKREPLQGQFCGADIPDSQCWLHR